MLSLKDFSSFILKALIVAIIIVIAIALTSTLSPIVSISVIAIICLIPATIPGFISGIAGFLLYVPCSKVVSDIKNRAVLVYSFAISVPIWLIFGYVCNRLFEINSMIETFNEGAQAPDLGSIASAVMLLLVYWCIIMSFILSLFGGYLGTRIAMKRKARLLADSNLPSFEDHSATPT